MAKLRKLFNKSPHDFVMYEIVANRRNQWDLLLWQVPALTFTAQAFLLTIALNPGTDPWARICSTFISIVVTFLCLNLMARHRQAEVTDAEWLERYERQKYGYTVHGKSWAEQRRKTRHGGCLNRFRGYRTWAGGIIIIGIISLTICTVQTIRLLTQILHIFICN